MAKAYRGEEGQVLGYLLVEIPRSTLDAIVKEDADQYNTMHKRIYIPAFALHKGNGFFIRLHFQKHLSVILYRILHGQPDTFCGHLAGLLQVGLV